ncbi:MAG TPA: hypothetical protein VNT75_31920 [Symbiobacteriaceae bacterium]|nr:hypothetical protein [Symbiobacteriaceae bacterium]
MTDPDRITWRPATGEDLWQWSWQGRGLFRSDYAPVVRILDDRGHTIAEGVAVAYDLAEQTIALLGPSHRAGTALWSLAAAAHQIWIRTE